MGAGFTVGGVAAGGYAGGDVVGPPSRAARGGEQAKAASTAMFEEEGAEATVGRDNFPVGVWTIPEIGYFGFT